MPGLSKSALRVISVHLSLLFYRVERIYSAKGHGPHSIRDNLKISLDIGKHWVFHAFGVWASYVAGFSPWS